MTGHARDDGGGLGDVAICGGAPLRPGHTPLVSLRSLAPLSSGTKGAVDSCLRRNDGGGSRNDGGGEQG